MAELQGQQTNPAHTSAELLEIVYQEATGRWDTDVSSKSFLWKCNNSMGFTILSFPSRRILSGQVGETGLSAGGAMEELTGSPGSNHGGERPGCD